MLFRSGGSVVVAVGGTESLTVEADDNLQEYLEASVSSGVLEITSTMDIAPSEPPVFRIGVEAIVRIEHAGAGLIEVDAIATEQMEVVLSGVGEVTIGNIDVRDLLVRMSGVGTITVAGTAQTQDAAATGVGVYDGSDLISAVATVVASGEGEAIVWVTDELQAIAGDTGIISYYGDATVTEEVSGLGTVTALGAK